VVRQTARLRQNACDIRQCLFDLDDEIVTDQICLIIPADLARNENLSSFSHDAIDITLWREPIRRL
jgi:hypothetical protein